MLILNVGLQTNTGGTLASRAVLAALMGRGCVPVLARVEHSATELTAVVIVDQLNDRQAHGLCTELGQDCIAVYNPATQRGRLIGPKAAAWGTFDPSYFIMPSGEFLA